MSEDKFVAIDIWNAPARPSRSAFPEEFSARLDKREKHPLGDLFGLTVYGINLTKIGPGGQSAIRHAHSVNDEFIYIVQGEATLVTDAGETPMKAGMCAGFKAGTGDAHHLLNKTNEDVYYLEIGDRLPNDEVIFPDDDLAVVKKDGKRSFFHKDGTPY
jgi:uncharacterized cupin superfamily protein